MRGAVSSSVLVTVRAREVFVTVYTVILSHSSTPHAELADVGRFELEP